MACLVRVPTEVVKLNLQTSRYRGPIECIKSVFNTDGLRGIYRGFNTTLIREIPFSIIQFPLYEQIKVSVQIKVAL